MSGHERKCTKCDGRYVSPSDTLADMLLCKACQNAGADPLDAFQATSEADLEADADRFQAALQELVAAAREAVEKRKNMGDHRQRLRLENALAEYCTLIEAMYGTDPA